MAVTETNGGELSPEMGQRLHVAASPEQLTPPAEIARGVLIYEDYIDADFGTHIQRGIAKIAGVEVDFTDEWLDDDKNPNPERYVLIPGFMGIKPSYSKIRRMIALGGGRATTYKSHPDNKGLAHKLNPVNLITDIKELITDPWQLLTPEVQTSKAGYAVVRRAYAQSNKPVHLVGHSMGGPISLEIAAHKLDKVGSVTVIGSAGLEDHNMLVMASRLPGFFKEELVPALPLLHEEFDLGVLQHVIDYVAKHPYLTAGEMRHVVGVDSRQTIQYLRNKEIPVDVIQMVDDHLFDEATVHQNVSRFVRRYRAVSGNHLKPQLEPDETADLILDAA